MYIHLKIPKSRETVSLKYFYSRIEAPDINVFRDMNKPYSNHIAEMINLLWYVGYATQLKTLSGLTGEYDFVGRDSPVNLSL
jgi:hypothetical protein